MKTLVIGYGSIGARHASILAELGIETAVVSQREVDFPIVYSNAALAIEKFQPELIIIASKTADHKAALHEIYTHGWKGIVLVEKPLFHESGEILEYEGIDIFVAYNLRQNSLLLKLKEAVKAETILSVTAYSGQHLSGWRPSRDYRLSYSSRKEEGGGVLRDLSHEIDYLLWICGPWRRVAALGGQWSSLEISSDDFCGLLLELERCPMALVQMNLLDRPGRRELVIVTDQHTYKVDFTNSSFEVDGIIEYETIERNDTYKSQIKAILENKREHLCTYSEGLEVIRLIDNIEKAISNKEWIWNE